LKAYFDTSIVVPIYVPDRFSASALARLAETEEIHLSNLTELEFYSALAKKIRTGRLTRPEVDQAAHSFLDHWQTGVYLRSTLTGAMFQRALEFLQAFATPLRSLDALHLACCASSELVLVTADPTLAEGAAHFGVPCVPLQAEAHI
jgi:uncharacterized protein